MQNHPRKRRLVRGLALGLAVVAIAGPVAQADVKTSADYPPAIAQEAAKSYGPLQAHIKTLADYPPAIAREAANSYGPLQVHIKTLADYPPAIAREAAESYGPLQGTPIQVVSKPDGFEWRDAAVDMATVLALVLLGAAALVGTRHKSHPTG
jgi:hypothetical protein